MVGAVGVQCPIQRRRSIRQKSCQLQDNMHVDNRDMLKWHQNEGFEAIMEGNVTHVTARLATVEDKFDLILQARIERSSDCNPMDPIPQWQECVTQYRRDCAVAH